MYILYLTLGFHYIACILFFYYKFISIIILHTISKAYMDDHRSDDDDQIKRNGSTRRKSRGAWHAWLAVLLSAEMMYELVGNLLSLLYSVSCRTELLLLFCYLLRNMPTISTSISSHLLHSSGNNRLGRGNQQEEKRAFPDSFFINTNSKSMMMVHLSLYFSIFTHHIIILKRIKII